MPKPKQQLDQDQISMDDPNESDVVAYAAAASSLAEECPIGTHWDGKTCVQDDVVVED